MDVNRFGLDIDRIGRYVYGHTTETDMNFLMYLDGDTRRSTILSALTGKVIKHRDGSRTIKLTEDEEIWLAKGEVALLRELLA